MRSASALLFVVLLAACAPADEAAEQPAEEQAPAPALTVADFAGMWQNTAMLEGTPDPVMSTMSGSADGTNWTMTLEGRDPIPMQVSIVGDSLIAQSVEYESILRPGVMVTVRTASVLVDGMLQSNLLAIYRTPAGEEQVRGTMQSTRMPH